MHSRAARNEQHGSGHSARDQGKAHTRANPVDRRLRWLSAHLLPSGL